MNRRVTRHFARKKPQQFQASIAVPEFVSKTGYTFTAIAKGAGVTRPSVIMTIMRSTECSRTARYARAVERQRQWGRTTK